MTNKILPEHLNISGFRYRSIPFSEDHENSEINSYELSLTPLRLKHVLSHPLSNIEAAKLLEHSKLKLRGILAWLRVLKYLKAYGRSGDPRFRYISDPGSPSKRPGSYSCLIYPESKYVQLWSFLMLILLLYVFIVTPLLIAFEDVEIGSPIFYVELIVDLLFFCDILITLNSAFFKDNTLVISRWEIFKNYLSGLLILDLLAIFPFYVFEENGNKSNSLIRIIRITKVVRVFRASKLFKFIKHVTSAEWLEKCINMIKTHEGFARLIAAGFFMLIMAHITACMWFFTAKLDDFGPETWVVRNEIIDYSKAHQYLYSLYWAFTILTTVGFGDIYAVTSLEMGLCIFWLIFGVGFYTFLLGTLTSVLSSIHSKNAILNKKIKDIEDFAYEYNITKNVVKKMKREVNKLGENDRMDEETRMDLLDLVSKELRFEICENMNNSAIQSVSFFKNQDRVFITHIVPRLEYEIYYKYQYVYEKGDHPDKIYFIVKGRVNYLLERERAVFKSMIAGGYFGEIELINNTARHFSVQTHCESNFLTMNAFLFRMVCDHYPKVAEGMKEHARVKKLKNNEAMEEMMEVVEAVHIKKECSPSELRGRRARGKTTIAARDETAEGTIKSSSSKGSQDLNDLLLMKAKIDEILELTENYLNES